MAVPPPAPGSLFPHELATPPPRRAACRPPVFSEAEVAKLRWQIEQFVFFKDGRPVTDVPDTIIHVILHLCQKSGKSIEFATTALYKARSIAVKRIDWRPEGFPYFVAVVRHAISGRKPYIAYPTRSVLTPSTRIPPHEAQTSTENQASGTSPPERWEELPRDHEAFLEYLQERFGEAT